jgi:hydroxyacylglutathione hydrolase
MFIQQLYTPCLAQACYYVESLGEAVLIDPLRDIQGYLEILKQRNATLRYIMETHFHADFVGGHIDLAKATGAAIVFGPGATPAYEAYIASDHERFVLGEVELEILHTPGHTLESISILLKNQHKPYSVFTGDTLFIGDVGRPDLVQKLKPEITPSFLAAKLYDSLREKIMPLPDEVIIYPGHGAGSACGKHLSKETSDTLGNQRKLNFALHPDLGKEEFIQWVTNGLTNPPAYFPENVLLNITGADRDIDTIIQQGFTKLTVDDIVHLTKSPSSVVVVDTRSKEAFIDGHIPGSLFIGLEDNFAPWAGTLIKDLTTPLILVCTEGSEVEGITRLTRVGFDHTLGYLQGGIDAWQISGQPYSKLDEMEPEEYAERIAPHPHILLDVRRKNEFDLAHIQGAWNHPLDYLNQSLSELDKSKEYYLHCAGGYRSVIAASILQRHGFTEVVNIKGGFKALQQHALPLVRQEVEAIDI